MSTANHDGHYEVFWPRAERRQARKALAPRLDTLSGKTIALVWDYLFKGDEIMRTLQDALTARFPDVRFIGWEVFGNTHGGDERKVVAELPGRLKELGAHAVISGMAC